MNENIQTIDIVFDGPPGKDSPRFVEVERDGKSIKLGEWVQRGRYWALRIPDTDALTARVKELEEALRPFAKFAEAGFDGSVWEVDWSRRADEKVFSINHEHQVQITLGDFRTAIAALNKEPTT